MSRSKLRILFRSRLELSSRSGAALALVESEVNQHAERKDALAVAKGLDDRNARHSHRRSRCADLTPQRHGNAQRQSQRSLPPTRPLQLRACAGRCVRRLRPYHLAVQTEQSRRRRRSLRLWRVGGASLGHARLDPAVDRRLVRAVPAKLALQRARTQAAHSREHEYARSWSPCACGFVCASARVRDVSSRCTRMFERGREGALRE